MLIQNTNYFHKYITKSLIISKHNVLNNQLISLKNNFNFKILINQESKFEFLVIFWFFVFILKTKPRLSLTKKLKSTQELSLTFNIQMKTYDSLLQFIKIQKKHMVLNLNYCKKYCCFYLDIKRGEVFFKNLDYILTRLELKSITVAMKLYFIGSQYTTEIKPII